MEIQVKEVSKTQLAVQKLSWFERIGYGFGDLSSNLIFQMISNFLMFFYTDVYGIGPGIVATLFFVTKIWDAVFDLVLGALIDKTKSRFGKARPYLLYGTPAFIISGILCFSTPDLNETGKIVYAYITYFILGMAYSLVNIPYSTLTARMTQDFQERSVLSSVRMMFAMLGGLIVSALTMPLVDWLGAGSPTKGWQWTMVIFSLVGGILYFLCFLSTKERVVLKTEKYGLKDIFRAIFKNKPFLSVSLSFMFALGALSIQMAAVIYYFKYYIGNEDLVTPFFTLCSVAAIIGPFFAPYLSKKMGKRNASIFGGVISAIASGISYFGGPSSVELVFITNIIASIFSMIPTAIGWGMCADTVEYAEWKHGVRPEGVIYAAFSFVQKVAMAIGSTVGAAILATTGYVADAQQSEQTLEGIRYMMTLLPAILTMLSFIAIMFYNLSEEKYNQMMVELKSRN
ncbi:MFS transporter [Brevibacillus ginsengisoli]|uniref:MFS transporter n=1 Tax=Brevibacillus ginsengisoli TaxID=363854 RepID=UPI003CF64A41